MSRRRRQTSNSESHHDRRLDAIYRRRLAGLLRSHNRLSRKLAIIGDQIQDLELQLGIRVRGHGPAQVRNPATIADTIAEFLTKRPMSITDITESVRQRGYMSFSPNFRGSVSNALRTDKRFKRVGRGLYVRK